MHEPGSDVMNELPRVGSPLKDMPPAELEQPDPQLSLSSGKASALQITLTAVASLFILGLMIYGLNQPLREPSQTASAPPAQETTGAAPQAEPAQQPQPEPQKPAQSDDSKR
jgi:hypothetical protein